MQWSDVIENPYLQDLPFKIELNKFGKILMSPASNQHGRLEYKLGRILERGCPEGEIIIECSIKTSDGVKVADVAWASAAFIQHYGYPTPYPYAPEICIEIVSPSNSKEEMCQKVKLYLESGAIEVWIVWENDSVDYYNATGKITSSAYGIDVKLPL
jgi:Uma2 family endonuclease